MADTCSCINEKKCLRFLQDLVLNGDVAAVKQVLATTEESFITSVGHTLLQVALDCFQISIDIMRAILDAGVDVNTYDSLGYTPLMLTAKRFDIRVIEVLITSGADVNIVHRVKNETALSIIFDAVLRGPLIPSALACVDYLLDHGASVQCVDPVIIHRLIAAGRTCLALRLIRSGIGPVIASLKQTRFRFTCSLSISPLCCALLNDDIKLATYINKIMFLTKSDLSFCSSNQKIMSYFKDSGKFESLEFIKEMTSQPMSLQKLCFVAVSVAISCRGSRSNNVDCLPLPDIFKSSLCFQTELVPDLKSYVSSDPFKALILWMLGEKRYSHRWYLTNVDCYRLEKVM